MASELHVDSIKHSGGTSAMTIDSSGNLTTSANFHSAGSVVQVVEKISTASNTFTSNSYSDHDELAITPKFSTSRMYLSFIGRIKYDNTLGNGDRIRGGFRWNRFVGGSSVATYNHSTEQFQSKGISNDGGCEFNFTGTYTVFDTPATSNQITYKLQVQNSQNSNNFIVSHGQIVIMEIAV